MQILKEGAVVRIIPTDCTGGRAKALFSLEALGYGMATLVSLSTALFSPVLGLAGAVIFGIAFWRHYKRVVHREELLVGYQTITIITNNVGRRVETVYEIAKISNLHYLGFEHPLDHPLKTDSFDYLGFQTQSEVVNAVMAEGNLAFEYESKTVRFFIGVPSWDVAEMNEVMREHTFDRLSIEGLPEEIEDSEWRR